METKSVHFRIQSQRYNHLPHLEIFINVYWLYSYLVETVKLSKVNVFRPASAVSGRKPFLGGILLLTNVARPVCAVLFRSRLYGDTELTN